MAVYEVIHGLVLRETESREADKILTVLSAERGRIGVIARGARRKNSRISAAAQLYVYSEMTVYESRGYLILTEASTAELFMGLRAELPLLALAGYFADLAEEATEEGEDAEELLRLLLNALYALSALGKPPDTVKAAFELRLLSLAGFAPRTDACMHCGRAADGGGVFDLEGGGLLCPACAEGHGGVPLSAAAVAALRYILTAPAKRLYAFSLRGDALRELVAAAERYTEIQLDRRFRSLDFYKSVSSDGF